MATTTNKYQLTLDDEAADRIVICSLRESIDTLERSINKITSRKKLTAYDRMALVEEMDDLSALQKVYNYYGGNL